MVSDHTEPMDPREYIEDHRQDAGDASYEYYSIRSVHPKPDIPLRVALNEEGLEFGADTIDAVNQRLVRATHLMTEAKEGAYGNDSHEEEFWQLCAEHVEYAKKNLTADNDGVGGGPG